ncbi:hypothetical protein [Streptomyces sedi]|uniref:Uncharacterized protein n=1 Tax=Streptomyces sedi TaxID=555059 RepID=A0A5C4UQK5_9ACTN|nr:hypothetical protein [Streptomyces sedi]TNM25897.1 hypothetical protein FH715_25350 [Streptomyces sedi]
MIPAGRTPADSARAAQLLGVSLGTFRNRRAWERLPRIVSRPGARQRIWDEEQLVAAVEGWPVPPLPDAPHPDDLLDLEEARLALPEERRPTAATWASYVSTGRGPEPDEFVFGVPHFRRRTLPAWLAARPGRGAGGGRPEGARDSRPRDRSGDPRHRRAEERRERVRELLVEGRWPRPEQLAEELSVSRRQAERLVAQARAELVDATRRPG